MTPVLLRFDFSDPPWRRRTLMFSRPLHVIEATSLDQVLPAMRAVDEAQRQGLFAAGFVSYEAAPAFDSALTTRQPSSLPLVWFGVFDTPCIADGEQHESLGASTDFGAPDWRSDVAAAEYRRNVGLIREAIAAGDTYQTNYTFRLEADLDVGSLHARYRRLLDDQRPPYAACLDTAAWCILSLSPELFFRIRNGWIVTKPMKGTAPRGLWSDDDAAQARALASSEKNRAENVMIVDLARNDVGRLAEIGSVRARSLFDVERYPTVLQMVSTVEARLCPGSSVSDAFAALFPAGSVTGAPKASSMRLINAIERSPRGLYCGAIGYVTPAGEATFNVAIRTAVTDRRTGRTICGVGGGITWDSEAAAEHAEAVSKAGFFSPQPRFELIETMRQEGDRYVRLSRHLRRLFASADYFGFSADEGIVRDELAARADGHDGTHRRVRVSLLRDGTVHVESRPLDPPPAAPPVVAIADQPVSRLDRFLHHKTTRRDSYDARRANHPLAFDVLLWNEEREVTEFTIGNVVVEIDGERWTPPRSSGLLGGIFREELLETGVIRERVVTLGDLGKSSRVWLINSVREWVEVRRPGPP